ncbi:N-glycosidase [Lasiodiplodia theobromae]|uniref:N-glycosidase n=1 Tax=Lasiodiplodia theobromae TaxID=45133 RepID=A0A5N5CX22_9PEZI|nr:N-glycosidase [Lasiodiplodia theobromae]
MSSTILGSDADKSPIYFWREYDEPYGFLSQWYDCAFQHEGVTYRSAEMWMMVQKAKLFGDAAIANQMLAAPTPAEHKKLGRKVKNFNHDVWDEHKSRIVEEGNWWKFTSSKEQSQLRDRLLATGDRELVEASPYDRIWGIGFSREHADGLRDDWGENLLALFLWLYVNMSLPYTNDSYDELYTYCGKTRHCQTDNPYDVDIAGIGVLVSFILTAAFTLLAIIIGYLCECLPGTATNHVDQAVIVTVTTFVKFCFRPSLSRIAKLRDRLSTTSLRQKHLAAALTRKCSAALERFILTMSDQQLVTGIAIMVTIYTKSCDISIYSFQIAAALAWFSSTTHLATLTLLRAYFDHHRIARNFRAVMMVMMMIMLAAAQIISNSESVQHSSTDIYFGCALKKSFKLSPIDGYEITNLVLIIAWLIQSYSSRMIAIYSTHTSSSYSWLTRQIASIFHLELDEPTAEDDSLRKLEEVMQAVDGRLRDGPLRQWPLLRRFCVWYTYFFALAGAVERAFTNSFLWQLIRLLFGASFGIGQVISIRKDYPVAYRRDQETETLNKWGFGQILPLIFLAYPILTGLEAYFEVKDEIERHMLNRRSTSSSSQEAPSADFVGLGENSSTTAFAAEPVSHGLTITSTTASGSVHDLPLARIMLLFYILMWFILSQLLAISASTNFSDLGLLIPLLAILAGFYIWSVVVFEGLELVNAANKKRKEKKRSLPDIAE